MDYELIVKVRDFIGLSMFVGMLFSGVLWVIFSWITMRKLRKNTETKDHLGVEFISGYDAFNVSHALVFGKYTKHDNSDKLDANLCLIHKYTTKFDRVLGRIFCVVSLLSTLLLLPFMLITFFV